MNKDTAAKSLDRYNRLEYWKGSTWLKSPKLCYNCFRATVIASKQNVCYLCFIDDKYNLDLRR